MPKKFGQVGPVVLGRRRPAASGPGTAPRRRRRTRPWRAGPGSAATSPGWRNDSAGASGAVPADLAAPAAVDARTGRRCRRAARSATGAVQTTASCGRAVVRPAARAASCWCRSRSWPGRSAARRPGRPGEERGQVVRYPAGSVITFGSRPFPCWSPRRRTRRSGWVIRPRTPLACSVGEDQCPGGLVVAVGSEVAITTWRGSADRRHPARLNCLRDVVGRAAQVVGGVVGARGRPPCPTTDPYSMQTAGAGTAPARR